MSDDMKWGAPPPRRNPSLVDETRSALRSRPGEWALVTGEDGVKTPSNLYSRYPRRDGYEVTIRKRDDGAHDVWVRYVGEAAS